MNLEHTFRDKKVFLTGHTGFKGAWMLLVLKKLGARVTGYALSPKSEGDLYHQIDGDQLCRSIIADIRDRNRLRDELLKAQPDFVFHFAAQALVIDSYTSPVETYETNVMGTVYLLDTLRQLSSPCISVLITTDKVYENFETLTPYAEDARLGGYDPYSNSKACAELAIASYRNSFFKPEQYKDHLQSIASARSGNVIGGGDWSENRLVPDIARALIAGKAVTIRNPTAVRPWQHVLDPINGYLYLAARMQEDPVKYAEGFNFGPHENDERNVLDMCKAAISSWGEGSYEILGSGQNVHEAGLLKLNIVKAQKELGWSPTFNSAEAVEWTIEWYRDGRDKALAFTEMQIENFFKRA